MHVREHLIYSTLVSIFLYPFFGWNILLFVASSVLIDFDHYLYYVVKYRRLNITDAYRYWTKNSKKFADESILPLHTIELFILMIILSFFNKYLFAITFGMIFHTLLDIYYEFFIAHMHKDYSLIHSLIYRMKYLRKA